MTLAVEKITKNQIVVIAFCNRHVMYLIKHFKTDRFERPVDITQITLAGMLCPLDITGYKFKIKVMRVTVSSAEIVISRQFLFNLLGRWNDSPTSLTKHKEEKTLQLRRHLNKDSRK